MLDKKGFKAQNIKCEDLPQAQSNNGHKVRIILEPFITSIWCVANRFMCTEATRLPTALENFFNWNSISKQGTYKRFFNTFNQTTNQKFSNHFYSWIFDNFKLDHFTLNAYSFVMTGRYGAQVRTKILATLHYRSFAIGFYSENQNHKLVLTKKRRNLFLVV